MEKLTIEKERVLSTINKYPETRKIMEEIFPEIKEESFKQGEIIRIYNSDLKFSSYQIIARISHDEIGLISIKDGNRFQDEFITILNIPFFNKEGISKSDLEDYINSSDSECTYTVHKVGVNDLLEILANG